MSTEVLYSTMMWATQW